MNTLLYLGIGAVALLASLAIVASQAGDTVEHLAGYDPAPGEEPGRGIRVNPDREPW